MVIGNAILFVTSFVLFHFTHLIGEPVSVTEDGIQVLSAGDAALRFAFFTIVSCVYYIGYTCQCVVTKSAQTCLTNDPKQRPLFSIFDSAFVMIGYIGVGSIAIPNLTKKYGTLYSAELFHDIWVICALLSAVLTVIAVIAIAPKDRIEFFDCEVYRTGKYLPGMMGTLFSFVDKLVSSAAPMIAGVMFAAIGFADKLPDVTTPYSDSLLYVSVFLMYGMIVLGNICNAIAMKFYPLNKEKMEEIQDEIAAIKAKAMAE